VNPTYSLLRQDIQSAQLAPLTSTSARGGHHSEILALHALSVLQSGLRGESARRSKRVGQRRARFSCLQRSMGCSGSKLIILPLRSSFSRSVLRSAVTHILDFRQARAMHMGIRLSTLVQNVVLLQLHWDLQTLLPPTGLTGLCQMDASLLRTASITTLVVQALQIVDQLDMIVFARLGHAQTALPGVQEQALVHHVKW